MTARLAPRPHHAPARVGGPARRVMARGVAAAGLAWAAVLGATLLAVGCAADKPEPAPLGSVTRIQVTAALSHSLLAERVAAR